MAKFTLSAHAQTVMAERGIHPDWVERVLTHPERMEQGANDPVLRHAIGRISENGNRVLRVVYNSSVEPVRIVTVYFDRTLRGKL
ncbi:MAG: DUF4258 domain-containing protein [Burkholderiales bacterium]|nr:DUF4258 domain-containing protein [Burkholderiales bacterium]